MLRCGWYRLIILNSIMAKTAGAGIFCAFSTIPVANVISTSYTVAPSLHYSDMTSWSESALRYYYDLSLIHCIMIKCWEFSVDTFVSPFLSFLFFTHLEQLSFAVDEQLEFVITFRLDNFLLLKFLSYSSLVCRCLANENDNKTT